MNFLHPGLLAAGLAAISIPIIIHLLMHRRRKPVMWGAMRFLVEAYKRQRRRLMLEKWLLLACRCLMLALIAVALAQPLLGGLGLKASGKTVYLLIDNSLASGARSTPGGSTALTEHKSAARTVLDALQTGSGTGAQGDSDRIALITLGGPADGLIVPPTVNPNSVRALLDQLEPTDSRADLAGALRQVAQSMNPPDASAFKPRPDRTLIIVLSDFTEGSLDLSPIGDQLSGVRLPEGTRIIALSPADVGRTNVSISGLEPLRTVLVDSTRAGAAGLTELVRVQLRRSGTDLSQAQTTTVRAQISLAQIALADAAGGTSALRSGEDAAGERAIVRWAPGQDVATAVVPVRTDRANLRSGPRAATSGASNALVIAAIDDDALPADNFARAPIELRDGLKVGIVAPARFAQTERVDKLDAASWVRLALAPSEQTAGIDTVDIEPATIDGPRLVGLDAVVLPRPDLLPESAWARLRVFIDAGGLVLVMPPSAVSVHVWPDAMIKALGVDWTLGREAIAVTGKKLAKPAVARGADSAAQGPALLSLIEGEMEELLSPVSIERLLPVQLGIPTDSRPTTDTGPVRATRGVGEVLLTLDDQTPVLWAGGPRIADSAGGPESSARGLLVYLAVPMDLEWSDLPAKPLMLPLLQEIVRQGIGQARGTIAAIAGNRPSAPSRTTELVPLADPARLLQRGAADLISPENARVRVNAVSGQVLEPIRRAGVYRAMDERGASRGIVVLNADTRGGRVGLQSADAVQAALKSAIQSRTAEEASETDATRISTSGSVIMLPRTTAAAQPEAMSTAFATAFGARETGASMWWPLLCGALALALLEIALARRASHADADREVASLPTSSSREGGAAA